MHVNIDNKYLSDKYRISLTIHLLHCSLSAGSILRSCLQPSRSSKSLPSSTSIRLVPILLSASSTPSFHILLAYLVYVLFSFLPPANPYISVAVSPYSFSSLVHTISESAFFNIIQEWLEFHLFHCPYVGVVLSSIVASEIV